MTNQRRVVITGMGAVTCLGVGVDALWNNLLEGNSGIDFTTRFDTTDCRCKISGEVKDFKIEDHTDCRELIRLDRFCHLAYVAAKEALEQSKISPENTDMEMAGVIVSSGIGGLETLAEQANVMATKGFRRLSPLTVPKMIVDICSGQLSIMSGFKGPNVAVISACASGNHSIGESWWMIKRGDADVMMAGGTEACITALGVGGFAAMKALCEESENPKKGSRPFDANRSGFVPAEGAAVLIIEELEHAKKRGATIIAEIVGYGLSGDAHHITAPVDTGEGCARAVKMALKHADMQPEDIQYINAHGTSTYLNDKTETAMIKNVFGDHAYKIPINSTKSMIGHTLGAAGAIEAIVCAKSLNEGKLHPTINYETSDPACDLDYVPNIARNQEVTTALSTNLGFGGHNAALILKKWQE